MKLTSVRSISLAAAPLAMWAICACSATGDTGTARPDSAPASGASPGVRDGSSGGSRNSRGGDSGAGGVIVIGDSGVAGARCGAEFPCTPGAGGKFTYPPEHLSGGAPGAGGTESAGGAVVTGGTPSAGGTIGAGGATSTGGSTGCSQGMECRPGAVRYCDDPAGAEWSQSTCDTTGHWGKCVETTVPAAAAAHGCAQNNFAPEICCGPAMLCCQDNPNGPWVDGGSGACLATMCP